DGGAVGPRGALVAVVEHAHPGGGGAIAQRREVVMDFEEIAADRAAVQRDGQGMLAMASTDTTEARAIGQTYHLRKSLHGKDHTGETPAKRGVESVSTKTVKGSKELLIGRVICFTHLPSTHESCGCARGVRREREEETRDKLRQAWTFFDIAVWLSCGVRLALRAAAAGVSPWHQTQRQPQIRN